MPDYNYDWDPTDWEREERERKDIYWQKQEEYWERYRKWKEEKERAEFKRGERIGITVGLIVGLLMCIGALLLAI